MQIGMIGLSRMGAKMVRRLLPGGHDCIAYDLDPASVEAVAQEGARGSASLDEFIGRSIRVPDPRAGVGGRWKLDRRPVAGVASLEPVECPDEGACGSQHLLWRGLRHREDEENRCERCRSAEVSIVFY